MKIRTHPRLHNMTIGDEVYSPLRHLYARVEALFPAAVCVRVGVLAQKPENLELVTSPELWSAEEVINLSVCRICGGRSDLHTRLWQRIPFHVCDECASIQATGATGTPGGEPAHPQQSSPDPR